MGNCFTHESSGRIRSRSKSKSKSESRSPPPPRAVSALNEDTTLEKRRPLPPAPAQAARTPNCVTDKNKAKKKVRFAEEAVCGEVKKKAEEVTMRVKIVMKKKDVALLLAMLGAGDDQNAMDGILSN